MPKIFYLFKYYYYNLFLIKKNKVTYPHSEWTIIASGPTLRDHISFSLVNLTSLHNNN